MSRSVVLAGAPRASSLRWTESELFSQPPPPCEYGALRPSAGSQSGNAEPVKWRYLSSSMTQLHTGFSQGIDYQAVGGAPHATLHSNEDTSFFTTADLGVPVGSFSVCDSAVTSSAETDEILSQFYDHSFAVHEHIESSQIESSQLSPSPLKATSSNYHFSTGVKKPARALSEASVRLHAPAYHLSDLEDIPSAGYLQSIAPQTITVNLIVGVIAMSPVRTVTTRRWNREMQLMEMLVGDDTRAGFGITFWLLGGKSTFGATPGNGDMETTLSNLRPRDIILLRTVALGSFGGKVHGQSLRKNMTRIDLLHRRVLDAGDEQGVYQGRDIESSSASNPQSLKVRKVRDWILQFVGEAGSSRSKGLRQGGMGSRSEARKLLPPDTQ